MSEIEMTNDVETEQFTDEMFDEALDQGTSRDMHAVFPLPCR